MEAMKVGMVSLGCNKNRVDTEYALGLLRDTGYVLTSDPAEADILIVNTCGFISDAKEESIDTIFEMAAYKESGRCRLLVVTGCLAQRYEKELLEEIPEIDLLMGVNQYARLPEAIAEALREGSARRSFCADPHTFFEHPRVLTTPAYTAYIRIGEGCSNCCTFCAIPRIRGPYRSRDKASILREMETLAGQGVREHILVAQDTTRYGTDRGGASRLPELMREAAAIPGVDWLRVLYCYPDECDERLLDLIAETDNICSYLDLPVQHINDELLRRMRRRGDSSDIRRCLRGARERGLTLRTSLIVGFPGETDAQFEEMMDFVREARFDRMGAFAYSAEDDTPAGVMPDQVPEEVKRERLDRLMRLQREISAERCAARIGTVEKVLVTDIAPDGAALGRSAREAPETDGEIRFTAHSAPKIGSFVQVKITAAGTYDLRGEEV